MSFQYKELSDKAFYYHSINNFEHAEKIYRQLLKLNPDDVNILNLYGLLCISKNNLSEAISCLTKAFILKKSSYIASNLAKAYYLNDEPVKALQLYNKALDLEKSDDIYYSIALTYKKLNDFDNVILNYKKAIELNPSNYNALYNLSLAYKDTGDISNAVLYARKCTEINENDDEICALLSGYYEEANDYKNAINSLERAIFINNKNYLYYYNLGVLYSKIDDRKRAIKAYNNAIFLNKLHAESYVNLAALYKNDDIQTALNYLKIAYKIAPQSENVYLSLARTYRDSDKNEDSIRILFDALEYNPLSAEIYSLLAINYMDIGNYSFAMDYYDKALKIQPDNLNYLHGKAVCHKYAGDIKKAKKILEYIVKQKDSSIKSKVTLGMIYLTERNFDKGMILYSQRSKDTKFQNLFKQKVWTRGISLKDKNVLVFTDCGLGDTIMFSRYLKELEKLADNITLQTDKTLVPLLVNNFPQLNIVSKSKRILNYDVVIPIMDLPIALNMDFNSIPLSCGYLSPDKSLVEYFSGLEIFKTNKKKIGLFRQGNRKIFKNRSIDLKEFSRLFLLPDIKMYSFQIDKDSDNKNMVDLKKYIKDYNDTAALLSNIDILITIDSSIAHMAGALGIKTFLLLPYTAEWRWFNDFETTPWYDSIKIFRQKETGNWAQVINRVEKELMKL